MITSDWKDYIENQISDANIPTAQQDFFEIQIIMDILEGCKYRCPGCFVNKRNNYNENTLDNVYRIMQQIVDAGIKLDDITLGPTDFFGAENIEEILRHSTTKKILSMVEGVQHNTSIDQSVDDSFVLDIINILEKTEEYKDLNYDVQIAIDVDLMMNDDEYQALIDKRWKLFEDSSLKYEVSLLANIHESAINKDDVSSFARKRYGTVVEYVPSVMRSNKERMMSTLEAWKTHNTNYNLHADISHKTFQHIILNFNKNKIYLAPFIYENAAVYSEDYEVGSSLIEILQTHNEIVEWQYSNAGSTCQGCEMLNQCIAHMIPYFTIKTLEREDYCPLNRDLLCG